MASNDNRGKIFEPNYYAKTYFTNYEKEKSLNITYGSGLMKITIATRPKDNSSERADIINASLTGLKSQLLVDAMNCMEKDIADGIAEGRSYGTSVGMGDVVKAVAFTVINGKKCFVIAKVDAGGNVSEKTEYEFASDVNYFMKWDSFDQMKFSKEFNNDIEYNMLKNILIDFSRNISGAAAYGGLYLNRYEKSRDNTKITTIMDKLGISVRQNNNFQRSENSYFNSHNGSSSGNKNSEHIDYSDIENMLGSEDDD